MSAGSQKTMSGRSQKSRPQNSKDAAPSSPADLPDDCWGAIFARLDQRRHHGTVSLVCKRFLAIVNNLRTTLVFSSHASSSHAHRLYPRFPNLRSLHLSRYLADIGGFVERLALSHLPLHSLCLSNQGYFPRADMRRLGRSPMGKTLKSLSIHFIRLYDADLFVIAECFSYLLWLELNCGRYLENDDPLTDEGIKAVAMSLTSLVSFTFGCISNISYTWFRYLSSNCPDLRHLKVSCFDIPRGYPSNRRCIDFDFVHVFSSISSLELDHMNITVAGLQQLATADLKLKKLNLFSPVCNDIIGVRNDIKGAAMCSFLKSCRFLSELKLRNLTFSADTVGFDFAASIPKVKAIALFRCRFLPQKLLSNLFKNCSYLEEIYVIDTPIGTLEDSSALGAQSCMQKLRLGPCVGLCDQTLMDISILCPNLHLFFVIETSHNISEGGLRATMPNFRYIKHFSVNGGSYVLSSEEEISSLVYERIWML